MQETDVGTEIYSIYRKQTLIASHLYVRLE